MRFRALERRAQPNGYKFKVFKHGPGIPIATLARLELEKQ
jgi:hypothetical protein